MGSGEEGANSLREGGAGESYIEHINGLGEAIEPIGDGYEATVDRAKELLRHSSPGSKARAEENAMKAREMAKQAEMIKREVLNAVGGEGASAALSGRLHPPRPPPQMTDSAEGDGVVGNIGGRKKKDLAIGMAQGINESQLAVFVASLRKFSSPEESNIVLFLDKVSNKAREVMDK